MKDITGVGPHDLNVANSQVPRAGNALMVQIGSLEYLPDWGIDLAYFLDENVKFQNAAFLTYLVQRLAELSINVAAAAETLNRLFATLDIQISPEETSTALVAR